MWKIPRNKDSDPGKINEVSGIVVTNSDMRRTQVVNMKINMGNYTPIKMTLYRMPIHN